MTIYLPTDQEAADGIGAWIERDASDSTLASFEQDRYARLLRQHGHSPYAQLSGSVGATHPGYVVNLAGTVNRGAW